MIVGFYDQGIENIFQRMEFRKSRKALAIALHHIVARKLAMLDAARFVEDLRIPPGNMLEKLKGTLMNTIHMPKIRNPFHPREILEEEFLQPNGITQSGLARALGTTHAVINEISRGKRGISAAMALKLAKHFKMSPDFWMNLQMNRDLWKK